MIHGGESIKIDHFMIAGDSLRQGISPGGEFFERSIKPHIEIQKLN